MGTIPGLSVSTSATRAATATAAVPEELKKAAKQFEAIFIRQMMSSMRTAKLGDDILGSDSGNQFRDMADSKTADQLAEKGSFGIADMLVKQFGARVVVKTGPAMGTTTPAMPAAADGKAATP